MMQVDPKMWWIEGCSFEGVLGAVYASEGDSQIHRRSFTVGLDGMSGALTYQQVMSAATRGASGTGEYTDWLPDLILMGGASVVENPWMD